MSAKWLGLNCSLSSGNVTNDHMHIIVQTGARDCRAPRPMTTFLNVSVKNNALGVASKSIRGSPGQSGIVCPRQSGGSQEKCVRTSLG
ncbi:hypothetical protein RRG08_030083 [Elysia crispata]|uniref:Uncharacterized protein n=1 Tax=Elysia crispata TaxID=231223 RepID=A0AAE1DKI3_9GAST|nr:hypothetical protein RRG08_030083 [Elysia crispata]